MGRVVVSLLLLSALIGCFNGDMTWTSTTAPVASTVCKGTTISGVAGTAVCGMKSVAATVTNMASASNSTGTAGTFIPDTGTTYSSFIVDEGSGFQASNVCSSATIFGLAGTASCAIFGSSTVVSNLSILASTVYRSAGTAQISQSQETTTYSNQAMPVGYRDIPAVTTDDEGICNSDSVSLGWCGGSTTPIVSVTYAQHIGMINCGAVQSTIPSRIADCLSKNPSAATWIAATNGIGGEANWSLVTRMTPDTSSGACALAFSTAGLKCVFKEVWQDQRTGYLWSSLVAGALNNGSVATGSGMAAASWCKGSGNNQAGDATCIGNTLSFCPEQLNPAIAGENWVANTPGSYTYDPAKGGMGRYSSPGVMWRLPTLYDYYQANIDGIRYVMPDMGGISNGFPEWTGTVQSTNRSSAYYIYNQTSYVNVSARSASIALRCVGR